jgi:ADP-dependent NAD(P)H-hydrate dehydratase / NAD(P)H-hydrate epimerase
MEIKNNNILLTEQASLELDRFTVSHLNTSGEVLMAMASQSIFTKYKKKFKNYSIFILSGSGNNGGDGFVLSYLFYNSGFHTEIFAKEGNYSSETIFHKNIAIASGVQIHPYVSLLEKIKQRKDKKILLIDAFIGSGFKGNLSPQVRDFFSQIRNLKISHPNLRILNVDTPSGFDGKNYLECMPIDLLCEIGIKKLKNQFSIPYARKYTFHEIGFPIHSFLDKTPSRLKCMENPKISDLRKVTSRDKNSNKYSNGAAGFIGGSKGMTGAILLSQKLFHILGGGISCIYSDSHKLIHEILKKEPSTMVRSLEMSPENEGFYTKCNSIVIGPGLSEENSLEDSVLTGSAFFILDAGILIKAKNWNLNRNVILTPHEGELKKLSGRNFESLEDKLDFIIDFCINRNTNILLKGPVNILGTFDGNLFLRSSSNSKLATMGTGDLLTGALAYFLTRSQDIVQAVQYSLYLLDKTSHMKKKHPTSTEILEYLGGSL